MYRLQLERSQNAAPWQKVKDLEKELQKYKSWVPDMQNQIDKIRIDVGGTTHLNRQLAFLGDAYKAVSYTHLTLPTKA